jgi:glucan phosphoethanolaminetransferase (alkaline phosphatase superfamily)
LELRYGRSAEYGVHILLQLASILDEQKEPSFLIFTSDHGENLPSDKTGKKLHGGTFVGRYEVRVPVLLLWNRAFAASGRLRAIDPFLQAQGVISHRDVANAWLELVGWQGKSTVTAEPATWGKGRKSGREEAILYSRLDP